MPPAARRPPARLLAVALLLLGLLSAAVAATKPTLEVLCAPAMRKPLEEMLAAFTKETGIRTQVSFDASGVLLGQLKLNPHGDVFIPADRFYVDEAVRLRLAEGRTVISRFLPVILVRKGNPHGIRTLTDLCKPGLRVGFGDERATAIGRATMEALNLNRVDLKKINVVYRAPKIDELSNAIKLGSIDVTVTFDAVAWGYRDSAEIIPIPAEQSVAVPVSAAIVSASKQKDVARRFLAFATSAKGQAILKKHHYAPAK